MNKETTLKHQFMVSKLAKAGEAILDSLTDHKAHLQHCVIGIMDEVYEHKIAVTNSDKENILEELGDLLFYTEALAMMGMVDKFNEFKFVAFSRDETYQLLAKTVKRHVFYEQELNVKDLSSVYKNLIKWIEYDASHIGKNLSDVQNHNMEKLAKRYHNFDYSDLRATTRQDKIESGFDDTELESESLGTKQPDCDGETCESCQ